MAGKVAGPQWKRLMLEAANDPDLTIERGTVELLRYTIGTIAEGGKPDPTAIDAVKSAALHVKASDHGPWERMLQALDDSDD